MEDNSKKKRSKKIWIPLVVLVVLAVLFVPGPAGVMDDGGTRVYFALTYKVIKWHRMLGIGEDYYDATKVYVFPNNFKSVSELWEAEGVDESDWEPEPTGVPGVQEVPLDRLLGKPVIYLYPEEETEVSVTLSLNGELTCTYPVYKEGWRVTALPGGTLTDAKGQTYNYLYWEGETGVEFDFSEGFCVKGEDTAAFLEKALEELGLTRREANEFIVYWLPMMEQNPYNVISFQTENYTETAKLTVSPEPDTLIRVFMAWKGAEEFTELPKQELSARSRTGFTVVEWGGTEVE